MQTFLNQFTDLLSNYVLRLLGPLTILVVGWLVALVIGAVVREVLHRTSLDNRLVRWVFGPEDARTVQVERIIARAVYYLVLFFVLIAFIETLGLTVIAEPLNRFLQQALDFGPRLVSAAILATIALVLAFALRRGVTRLLEATRIDERLARTSDSEDPCAHPTFKRTIADAVYWIVLLLFLPAVLNVLALDAMFRPVEGMVNQLFNWLPNFMSALLILIGGWFLSATVRKIVSNLLALAGIDDLSERSGLAESLGSQKLSGLIGLILHGFILLLILVAALESLKIEALTQPTRAMLSSILQAIPAVFAAALLIFLAYLLGRFLGNLATEVLGGMGIDRLRIRAGSTDDNEPPGWLPSFVAGRLVLAAVMLFAVIEALRLMQFSAVAELLVHFTTFAARAALGLFVFAVGLYFSGLAARAVSASRTPQSALLSVAARLSILILGAAMALQQMGLANEIISTAFALLLGAVTLSVSLAFGLGGRDIAKRELEEWVDSLKAKRSAKARS